MGRNTLQVLGLASLLLLSAHVSAGGGTELLDGDGAAGDVFGTSLSLDGDVLVVGSPEDDVGANVRQGSASVFRRTRGVWSQEADLVSSLGAAVDNLGAAVAVSGDVIVAGSYRDDIGLNAEQGSATVFRWNGTSWAQEQVLTSFQGAADDWFGAAVAIDGDVIVVGAYRDDVDGNLNEGSATVFRWNGATWLQDQYLTDFGGRAGDHFGFSVAVDGDVIACGSYRDDLAAITDLGSVTVFRWDGGNWVHEDKLLASDGAAGDNLGFSVDVCGDVLVAGRRHDDAGLAQDVGSVIVWRWDGAEWVEGASLVPADAEAFDATGSSVSLDGNVLAVGAPRGDTGPGDEGTVTVFRWTGAQWEEETELGAVGGLTFDAFGDAVAVSGTTVAGGAPLHDVGGAVDQGSAAVHDLPADPWVDLGGGSPGAAGTPTLTGSGLLVGGAPAALTLASAPPGALMLAWVSFSSTPFAALGGTVHAFPFSSQLFFTADGSGAFVGATTWPTGLPSDTQVWFQFLVQDGSVPDGITLSNALLATTP